MGLRGGIPGSLWSGTAVVAAASSSEATERVKLGLIYTSVLSNA
jgi:hypothetical protein